MVRATDQMGYETTICYDDSGAQAGKVRPDGSTEGLESDDRGRIVRMISAAGAVTEVDRDDAGRITRWKLPGRGEYAFAYNDNGDIQTIQLPAGREIFLEWSPDRRAAKESDASGPLAEYRFDLSGRMVCLKDALGFETHYRYDASGNRHKIVYPDGSSLQVQYDAGAHLTQLTDEEQSVTHWKYDEAGRRVEASRTTGETILCSYDTENRVAGIRDFNGLWHRYAYTPRGLVAKQEFADGRSESYRYDPRGLLITMTDSIGAEVRVERDEIGRPVRILYPDGTKKHIQYDEDGRWLRAEWAGHYRERELTPEGQAVQERQDDYYLRREYGDDGALISITDGFGRRVTYSRSEDGRVTRAEITDGRWEEDDWLPASEPRLHEFDYDRMGNMIEWRMPSGKVERRSYDARHRMIRQRIGKKDKPILERSYRYDRRGRLIQMNDSLRGETRYSYDGMSRLRTVEADGTPPQEFRYDGAGDLVSCGIRYAPGHRAVEATNWRLEYDRRGFLVRRHSRTGADDFEYTTYGLIRVANLANGEQIRYEYDPHSRLVKQSSKNSENRYFWNQDRLWALEAAGKPPVEFTYLPGAWTPFDQKQHGRAYSVHTDHLGRALELIDDEGTIVWTNHAGVWGEGRGAATHPVECPFGLPGQIWDQHTGMYVNRFRFYFPEIARYTAPDPIGIWGGLDCYRYVTDPVNHMDPLGLECRNRTDDPALYRGDRRPPETICSEGFQQWNPSGTMTLAQHVNGSNSTSQWVSTTYNREMAHEASAYGSSHDPDIGPRAGRWVYEIENPGCGVEVDCDPGVIAAEEEWAREQGTTPNLSEQEIAFDRAIPAGNIAGFYNLDTGEHGTC
jgi:RHS repeat-associated protein